MRRIGLLGLMLAVFTTSPAYATVFWDDDFEGSPPFAVGGTWGQIGACPSQPEGCTPFGPYRVNDVAHSGTHSLKSHYEFACGMVDGISGCGTHINRTYTATNDVYMRWWTKFVNNQVNPIAGSKQMYNRTTTENLNFMLVVWHIFPGDATIGGIFAHNGYLSFCPPGNIPGAQDQACNMRPNMGNTANILDGQWHCIETRVNSGTPGNYDGIAEAWVDGVPSMRYTGLAIKAPGFDSKWDSIMHYAQLGDGDRYIDQLAVGDSRIGCGNVSVQNPNPPAGLLVR